MKKCILILGLLFLPLYYTNAYIMSNLEVQYRQKLSDIMDEMNQVESEMNAKQKSYEGTGITRKKMDAILQPYYDTLNSLTNTYNWYVNEVNRLARLGQDCENKNAYYDSDTEQCICKQGYVADMFGNSCILDIKSCSDIYGTFSIDVGNNQCGCMYGYLRNDTMTECIKLTKDVGDKQCQKEFGDKSEAMSDDYTKCVCKNGYEWNVIKTKCVKSEDIDNTKTSSTTTSNTTKTDELQEAILWMYEKGLTIFNEPVSFKAHNGLRRDEAAKFFVQYAKQVMGKTPDYTYQGCKFNDLNQAWADLKNVIVESCQLGLFQGSNGKFMPTQQLTNAQAITVFMRLLEGYKDESGTHFANNYYESAHAQGFLQGTPLDNKSNFDNYTTRGNVAKMLFRGQKK